jgi:hypothetical protein
MKIAICAQNTEKRFPGDNSFTNFAAFLRLLFPQVIQRSGFIPKSNRAKYCEVCAKDVHRKQKAASERKRRSDVDK